MTFKTFQQFREDADAGGVGGAIGGGGIANAAGLGNVAGLGVGPKGEPGVDLRKKRKHDRELRKEDGVTVTTEATEAEIEAAAAAVHDRWMEVQKDKGHDEHLSPDGEEDYMVPYHKLSHDAKELDRLAVKTVIDTLGEQTITLAEIVQRVINEEDDSFAGDRVFTVDMDSVMKSHHGKNRYHRYSRYVGECETGEAVRQYGRSTGKNIILKDAATAVMTYLRRKPAK